MRKFWGVVGVLILLFSAFFVAAAIGDLVKGSAIKTPIGVLWGLLVFFGGTGIGGAVMIKSFLWRKEGPPPVSEFEQEQRILGLARTMQGHLTISDAALNCHLSIEDAKHTLDRMTDQGIAELRINDDGSYYYIFRSFLPATHQDYLERAPLDERNNLTENNRMPERRMERE